LAGVPRAAMETTPVKTPTLFSRRDQSPLVEREGELALVERHLAAGAAGRGSLLLLEGPAGIGKSRLLAGARERAEAVGFQVLRARAGELESDFAHGVVRQLFEPHLASCGEEERVRLLAGAARLAAPLLDLAEVGAGLADEDASFATLHGLYWLTANVAERAPALLVVDDLQWCDAPSLRFLSYLARRLDGLAIVVAASVRSGEPGADSPLVAELEADPATVVIRPASLTADGVAQVLRAAVETEPGPEFLRAVHVACGGNPLLLEELLYALLAEGVEPTASGAARVRDLGPEALSRFVLQRLRRLGPTAEALARAVAVLGDESDLDLAGSLAVLDPGEAAAAAAALARVEILRPRRPLGFVHPVLRAAVYTDLSDPERELAHERAAELIGATGAAPQQLAAHLLHVPPRGRAVATLREAARRSSAEGAADAARSYLRRALAEPPEPVVRADVLLELGIAELRAGEPGAIEHLTEASGLVHAQPHAAEVALKLAHAFYVGGRQQESAEVLLRTIEGVDPADAALVQRLEAQLIAWARFDATLYPMARQRLARIAPEANEESVGGRLLLALEASELARAGEAPERARALVERALTGDVVPGDESWQQYAIAVGVLLTLDELDKAVRRYGEWLEYARTRGLAFPFARAAAFRSLAMFRRGDLSEAEADARAALDIVVPLAGARGHPELVAHLAEALAERGEVDEAIATLDRAGVPAEERPVFQSARWFDVRGRLRIATGDVAAGLADLLAVGKRLEAFGVRNPSHSSWRSQAALVLVARGEREEAGRLVDEELAIARRWGAPRPLGVALRAAGLIEGGSGGLELLRQSVAVLAESQALLERAKSVTELGAALRRANQRAEARGFLEEGLELAERVGAAPVSERAHAELLATGARPRRLVRTGVDALTPSERRVAQMAAEGQSNREIAQALFVTAKTVEMHLSHAYRKLDIQARSQLARAMTKT
jgi:DNA-binding CsgD family transcriptional regulator